VKVLTLADLKFKPEAIVELTGLVENTKPSAARRHSRCLPRCLTPANHRRRSFRKKGLAQVSDTGAIEKFCDEAIAANPGPAADFKAGKTAALNFLKGHVMKLSKGKAKPGARRRNLGAETEGLRPYQRRTR